MNITDQTNRSATDKRDPRNLNQNDGDRNDVVSEELYENDELKQTNQEIADRGYTVRNGYDPNNPNPDQERITNDEDDLDDLDDDFHSPKDLEHDDDDDLQVNDEFDNPSDDFNETEDDEDLEDEDDLEEEDDFEDVEIEEDSEESYEENDPRKF